MKDKVFPSFLTEVEKPARYVGGEYNSADLKPDALLNFCMCFPDVYEVGMSNLGIRILYGLLNARADTNCERCFTPWVDYADKLKEKNLPLCSLESNKPLVNFDMIGFSMQYELSYTNVLYMLDLAGIPFRAAERSENHPLIIGGGPSGVNCLPYADFFDLIVIGDGEEALEKLAELYLNLKRRRITKSGLKRQFLIEADKITGVYVPAVNSLGSVHKVIKAVVGDLDKAFFPLITMIPSIEAVHDRGVLELFRGCTRGCRFCQAGFIYRPVRERSPDVLKAQAEKIIESTGYDEISLSSLSTGDYSRLKDLAAKMREFSQKHKTDISLPSLRMDSFESDFITNTRLSSLTFAPEAGTQRLRDVINKNITEQDIFDSVKTAFARGYSNIKLYFMLGLPTETDEDIDGIVNLCKSIKYIYSKHRKSKKPLNLGVSTSTFIPKPFTPFQWCGQKEQGYIEEKQRYLKMRLREIGCNYSYHDIKQSRIEAALARGGAELSDVIEKAYLSGCKFDGWSEFFDYDKWIAAFGEDGIEKYLSGLPTEQELVWDFIDIGVGKEYLLKEYNNALQGQVTSDCRKNCLGCGVNALSPCFNVNS